MTNPMTQVLEDAGKQRLESFLERIERLQGEKDSATEDIKQVYNEAQSSGYQTKPMREIIKLRKMEKPTRDEFLSMVAHYQDVLGGV